VAGGRLDGLFFSQGVTHTSVVRDGDTYVLVEWGNEEERPLSSTERLRRFRTGCRSSTPRNAATQPLAAIKKWQIEHGPEAGDTRRANLYYADRVEKYTASVKGTAAAIKRRGRRAYPWTDKNGAPLASGLHFRNRTRATLTSRS